MLSKNIFKNRQLQLLAYKILYDLIFLAIVTAFVSLIAEAVIPGLLSSHLSPLRIFVLLFFLLFITSLLGKKLGISYLAKTSKKSPWAALAVIFLFLLIGNSMLKFALWQNLVITLATIAIAFLLYKTLISPVD
jgi:hypothetical protein